MSVSFRERLEEWASGEPEQLLIELKDLRLAKQMAEIKLEKIEKRRERVKRRLREIRAASEIKTQGLA